MVTIPQHGKAGELYDIQAFLPDIDAFFKIELWIIHIEECLGEQSEQIEKLSENGLTLSDSEFRDIYKSIYQTIDGSFIGINNGIEVLSLMAIDSTSWDIKAAREFESYMMKKYGGQEVNDV